MRLFAWFKGRAAPPRRRVGEAALAADERAEIVDLHMAGEPLSAIAQRFSVSDRTIRRVLDEAEATADESLAALDLEFKRSVARAKLEKLRTDPEFLEEQLAGKAKHHRVDEEDVTLVRAFYARQGLTVVPQSELEGLRAELERSQKRRATLSRQLDDLSEIHSHCNEGDSPWREVMREVVPIVRPLLEQQLAGAAGLPPASILPDHRGGWVQEPTPSQIGTSPPPPSLLPSPAPQLQDDLRVALLAEPPPERWDPLPPISLFQQVGVGSLLNAPPETAASILWNEAARNEVALAVVRGVLHTPDDRLGDLLAVWRQGNWTLIIDVLLSHFDYTHALATALRRLAGGQREPPVGVQQATEELPAEAQK